MKDLLYKEFKLAAHPTNFIFLSFVFMLLIPAYPYFVAYIYTCLSMFFIFITGRENKDVFFTALLPVKKSDIVKARCIFVSIWETAQVLLSIPFLFLSRAVNPAGNVVGIEANAALLGLVFIMYGIYNILFFTAFYKNGYSAGKGILLGGSAIAVYIVICEVLIQVIPALKGALDNVSMEYLPLRLTVFFLGAAVFAGLNVLAYTRSAKLFNKVDL